MAISKVYGIVVTLAQRNSGVAVSNIASTIQQVTAVGYLSGPKGDKGDAGATGAGVPAGGVLGAVLQKSGSGDYITQWHALVSSDVGLGNVDNTSDNTKNAATATLTNKTISGTNNNVINIPETSVSNLLTDLAGKEPVVPFGTTGQYWRGDKTFQTLDTSAVPDTTDKRYITDAQRTVVQNTSGVNSGDQTVAISGGTLTISGAHGNTVALPSTAPTGPASGDLGQNYPNPTVVSAHFGVNGFYMTDSNGNVWEVTITTGGVLTTLDITTDNYNGLLMAIAYV